MTPGYKRIERASNHIMHALVLGLVILMFSACSDNKEPAKDRSAEGSSDTFTFFELGKSSRFSEDVRKNLSRQLGNDAIEKRSLFNLEINYYGFLQEHYPALHALNSRFNPISGERIEHNIIKLMYRYARKKNLPFDFVELIFSNYSRLPLAFKINFKKDEANVIQTLKSKYGEPRMVDWKNKNGQSMVWEKDNDILFVSMVPDQFGNPEFQIRIFFIDNIQTLLEQEKLDREKQELRRAKSGQKAF